MHYVIMNRNTLESFLAGHIKGLDNLFYKKTNQNKVGSTIEWTKSMSDAHIFEIDDEAWGLIVETWGMAFGLRMMTVLEVSPEAMEISEKMQDLIFVNDKAKWRGYADVS